MNKKVDKFARSKGSTANKVKEARQREKQQLNDILNEIKPAKK